MTAATWVLFVLGVLGAADIAVFHGVAHGIRRHAPSRSELLPHALRGPTYAALFLAVPNLHLGGAWAWGLFGVLAFDLGISAWDFSVERRSRAPLGGLSTGEYLLHVLIAALFGALVACTAFEAGPWLALPTELRYEPAAVPGLLRLLLALMAPLVLLSGALDLAAAIRLGRRGAGGPSLPTSR